MNVVPGKILLLKIVRKQEEDEEELKRGCWLDAAGKEIELCPEDIKTAMEVGDELEVFIFIDENLKTVATTMLPEFGLNEVGWSRVTNVGKPGAFVDIGSKRDIIIPEAEQNRPLKTGDKVVFVLKYDNQKNRIYGSCRFTKHFKHSKIDKGIGDSVEAIVVDKMQFGRRLVIENKWMGIIFRNDIMRPLRLGDKQIYYIKDIKDKEITLSMQKIGEASINEAKEKILDLLHQHNGYLRLTNDSDPEEIKLRLRMSKNTFKKVVGILNDEGKVVMTKRGIKTKRD